MPRYYVDHESWAPDPDILGTTIVNGGGCTGKEFCLKCRIPGTERRYTHPEFPDRAKWAVCLKCHVLAHAGPTLERLKEIEDAGTF